MEENHLLQNIEEKYWRCAIKELSAARGMCITSDFPHSADMTREQQHVRNGADMEYIIKNMAFTDLLVWNRNYLSQLSNYNREDAWCSIYS
jgi:hypothetical protein